MQKPVRNYSLDAAFHHAERLTKIKDDEDLKHCQKFGKD
jgi:hypothetical protein